MTLVGGFSWRAEGKCSDGSELRQIKYGVDAQGFGQLEVDRRRTEPQGSRYSTVVPVEFAVVLQDVMNVHVVGDGVAEKRWS